VVEKPAVTNQYLAATRDLPAGTILKESDIKWISVSGDEPVPANGIVKGKNELSAYVGGVIRRGVRADEAVGLDRIVQKGDHGFMSAVLTPGMRAVSVSVTPVGSVAGFVFPGDRVDVIVTHQILRKTDSEQSDHRVAETLLKNVRVLALDQRADDQSSEPKIAQIATLEVTPAEAESLTLVSQIGVVSLALCSQEQAAAPKENADKDAQESPLSVAAPNASQNPDEPPSLQPQQTHDVTWDSDISHVLEKPGNRTGAVQRIEVMRGDKTTESVFDLQK
jgi:pilus assembly protein CpaB